MVEGFTGLPGSGKTYYAALQATKAIQQGRPVFTNFDLVGARRYSRLQEVLAVRNGVIVVDEINLVCPSRFWASFPPELAYFWSQTRKFGLDIFWTAQHVDRVDRIIREISNYVWHIRSWPLGLKSAKCFIPEQIHKEKAKSVAGQVFRPNVGIWSRYDTYQEILPSFAGTSKIEFIDPETLPLVSQVEMDAKSRHRRNGDVTGHA